MVGLFDPTVNGLDLDVGVIRPGAVEPEVVLPIVATARSGFASLLLRVVGRLFAVARGAATAFLLPADVLEALLPDAIVVLDLGLIGVAIFAPLIGAACVKVEDSVWRTRVRGFLPARRESLRRGFKTLSFKPRFKLGKLCLCGTALDNVAKTA